MFNIKKGKIENMKLKSNSCKDILIGYNPNQANIDRPFRNFNLKEIKLNFYRLILQN